MKVLPFKIPKPLNQNLILQVDASDIFYNKLHQHKEFQLSQIVKGSGKVVVGDSIHQFSEGDFFVIGSNCPHLFQSNASTKGVKMISLFFTDLSFGNGFFDLAELNEVRSFFDFSAHGFALLSNKKEVWEIMDKLPSQDKLTRFIKFLELLKVLCESEKKVLTGFINQKNIGSRDGQRLQVVYDFVINNFQNEINLDTVSRLAYMTPNAFCRFFKNRTNKTFFQFLIALRLEHACQLLQETDIPIAEIAEQSGFNSISNFNRQFKAHKKVSPSNYVTN